MGGRVLDARFWAHPDTFRRFGTLVFPGASSSASRRNPASRTCRTWLIVALGLPCCSCRLCFAKLFAYLVGAHLNAPPHPTFCSEELYTAPADWGPAFMEGEINRLVTNAANSEVFATVRATVAAARTADEVLMYPLGAHLTMAIREFGWEALVDGGDAKLKLEYPIWLVFSGMCPAGRWRALSVRCCQGRGV